jgi:hypothetical protein
MSACSQEIRVSAGKFPANHNNSGLSETKKLARFHHDNDWFGSRLKRISSSRQFSIGSYVISTLFSPMVSRKFECLIASTSENRSFVSIYNSFDDSIQQISYESKFLHDAIYSLEGNNVYIVTPNEDIQTLTNDLEPIWQFSGFTGDHAEIQQEDRRHVYLRLHPSNPDVFFAFKERKDNTPVWCINNSSRVRQNGFNF